MPEEAWKRSYDIWKRANDLIERNESSFDLCDGVANLKRSLNHRLQLIEEIYHLKTIPFQGKPKGYLELLEKYNIVRPLVMKNLMTIRNEIEHNDSPPPEVERCRELVDIVWYFLKSTDAIVQIQKDSVCLELFDNGEETQYGCTVSPHYDVDVYFEVMGWFPQELVSEEEKVGYFKVEVRDYNGKEKFKHTGLHTDKLDTDRWVNGKIDASDAICYELMKCVLEAY